MREVFHQDLNQILDQMGTLTAMAREAMSRATRALVEADADLAGAIIADDANINTLREEIDAKAIDLLARQNPVATDLRIVVTAMRISSEAERMGDLAAHVAKVARRRAPEKAVPADVMDTFIAMGAAAEATSLAAESALRALDQDAAAEVEKLDDVLDAQHRAVFDRLIEQEWTYGMKVAVDTTLLSRYYERFGDHAVRVAQRVKFLVTGEPESLSSLPDRTPDEI
ncbi:phosphate signaling complex protein PhoU [Kribbia dieselivorans]|uniref:phosphate signaling complex protein PhoU n=1 Tax=Kribbia dieselivorans TaxID=331526 RepID=UPI0008382C59|nr:phosphate signaling complex protein PhoU [Kribbia dieselivorans]